ncbi:MAG: DUF2793 domain-containing protein [Rhizobiaceae bacterium]
MDRTPNLDLPYILPSQAQKHVTHNEAIRALDAIAQAGVLSRSLDSPPETPAEGDRYIVTEGASDDWSGHDLEIAAWQDDTWMFYTAKSGWTAWVDDEHVLVVWDGSSWQVAGGTLGEFDTISINGAAADTVNRIAASAPATLLNHEGNGHQLKINKNTAADTASVLFQTSFSGRAEFGLTGDDNWHVKVSPDGSTWHEAIIVDKDSGNVGIGIAPTLALDVNGSLKAQHFGGPNPGFIAYRSDSGKSCCVGAGLFTSYFMYDETGSFAIASQAAAGVQTGTANGKIDRITCDSSGNVGIGVDTPSTKLDVDGPVRVKSYTVAGVPSASDSGAGSIIFVSDETGGAVLAFSDGTNWRRVTDRVVIG